MTPSEFRALGRRVVDWIADYQEGIETLPVLSRSRPGDLLRALPASPPEKGVGAGGGWDGILEDFDKFILPGITHWQAPGFFAYFPCNGSFPAILGELLSAGLGIQGMLWATSPAATELETRMLEWLAQMIGLPPSFDGCIQGTASESTLVAMLAARHRAKKGDLVAYASEQAHSSVQKATNIAGVELRLVPVRGDLSMDPAALDRMIAEDRARGRKPFFVCATVGTTSSTAIDPLPPLPPDLWLHVDAAYAGSACVCPEFRWMIEGVSRADSFCMNPHKWLLTSFDCSAFWTRDRASLTGALSVTPEYLRTAHAGEVIDYRDWQIPLGRRFRALKLWFVIRHYGVEGLRGHVRRHVELAKRFEGWVREDPRFELCAERTLALVCFRKRCSDEENKALLERVNASGRAYLSHTVLPGKGYTLRMAIGAPATEERHVREAWDLLRA
jgi:aromatic-L-amino-acid/L-tryptophan decarboxylase